MELHTYDTSGTWKNNFTLTTESGKASLGGKRVATFDTENPTHYKFRYGSGLGGVAGCITFSY